MSGLLAVWLSALHAQTVGPVPRVWAVLTVPAPVAARGSHPVGNPNHVPSHICAETDGPLEVEGVTMSEPRGTLEGIEAV